jgi:Holliday junction resolvasome RuvABC endonuclease subunit
MPDGPVVVGLDLSLRSTGVAAGDGSYYTIRPRDEMALDRIRFIRARVLDAISCRPRPDLVVIEGYAFGAAGNSTISLAELGGAVRMMIDDECLRHGVLSFVQIPPPVLKKYATGKGTADKIAMVVAARDRLGYEGQQPDEADALWLREAGRTLLNAPVVDLPKLHQAALGNAVWLRRGDGSS